MGARTKGRAAAATVAFASVAAAGAVLAAPASADVTDLQVDNSALFGSVGENRYGVGCGYGVIATATPDEDVDFYVNGQKRGTINAEGGKATYPWIPLLPGEYEIVAKQGEGDPGKSTGVLTVVPAVYTGSSCIIL
ncbi:hypothetical protein GIY30_07785 [Gordonia sp. HNM0687]|uniref:Uncharacterized protein n=1 Tax=Gordonia mangrovi TaxID=2665643 RepID=A0A6L7GNT3_9ACTN|nr:hypothetical protein [Gordonia mangrovi]MXP21253.1 hypothetical protein [Gordonia mangrovi]UVF78220.1 hypothetical protein NWF22_23905 [Gordonia mangrovi]